MTRYFIILFAVNTLIAIVLYLKGGRTGIAPKSFLYIGIISLGLGVIFPFLLGVLDIYQVAMIFVVAISAAAFKIAGQVENPLSEELPDLVYASPAPAKVEEEVVAGEPTAHEEIAAAAGPVALEEPEIIAEEPIEEIVEEIVVTEEALIDAMVKEEAAVEEEPAEETIEEEAAVEEEPVEETAGVEAAIEEKPAEETAGEEAAVEEEPAEETAGEEAAVEEEPAEETAEEEAAVEEEPVEETAGEEAAVEEEPAEETAGEEAAVEEEPVEETAEEEAAVEEEPVEETAEEEAAVEEAAIEEVAAALQETVPEQEETIAEPVVAFELSEEVFTENTVNSFIDKGFAAKLQGDYAQAIQLFMAAVRLQPPVDLIPLLVIDISGMYIETGNYRQAWVCLENVLQDYEGYINSEMRKEIFTQMKYLEILQHLLQKCNLPPLPLAEVSDLVKVAAEEKTRRWKEEVFNH